MLVMSPAPLPSSAAAAPLSVALVLHRWGHCKNNMSELKVENFDAAIGSD